MKISDQIYVNWEHKHQKETICTVDRDGVIFTAISKTGHGDEFRKAIGRKLSLTRAIRTFTKQERTQIWNTLIEKGVSLV